MANRGLKCFKTCNLFYNNVFKNVYTPRISRQFSSFNASKQNPIYNLKIPLITSHNCIATTTRLQNTNSSQPIKINDNAKKEEEQQKAEAEEEAKKREQSWKAMKLGFIAFGSCFVVGGSYMLYQLGSPQVDEDGKVIEDEFSPLPFWSQFLKRALREMNYYQKMIQEPSREKLLPDPLTYPYVQPPYTLVLEIKDVLVHPDWTYQTGWRFKKRPGVDHFLEQIAPPLFEVVVFTADQGMTVFPILNALDPNGYITYRLVRDATHFQDGHHVKDLSCLNRDLSKVIVVDWDKDSVKFHLSNTILVPRWKGNDDDYMLVDLAAFLRTIALAKVDDVRETLEYYRQFENPVEAFRENQRKLIEQMEEKQRLENEKPKVLSTKGSWSPSFLSRKQH